MKECTFKPVISEPVQKNTALYHLKKANDNFSSRNGDNRSSLIRSLISPIDLPD